MGFDKSEILKTGEVNDPEAALSYTPFKFVPQQFAPLTTFGPLS
jgi:hypothetical protein